MQEKCPHCKQFFQIDKATKWLIDRAVQNNLKDIIINCTVCNKQVTLALRQPASGAADEKNKYIGPCKINSAAEVPHNDNKTLHPPEVNVVGWQQPNRYLVTVASAVNFLSGTIAQNESELLWEVHSSAVPSDQILLKQLSKKVIAQDSQMKAFSTILDIANEPATALHFRINAEGCLTALLNAGAIQKQWNGIKFAQLQEHILNNPWLPEVIKGFDEEYADFLKSVQRNPLYYLFFLPTGKMERDCREPRSLGANWQRLSQLFAPHFVDFAPYYTTEVGAGHVDVHLQTRADTQWLMPEFEKLFQEKYAAPTQLPLAYNFYLEGQYRFLDKGLLQNGKILIKEQANDHFFTTNQYTFNLLNE